VATTQQAARQLYRSFGFETFGTEPAALKVGSDYIDEDYMVPESTLIMDAHGNLYGTTYAGSTGPCLDGCGTVFELAPNSTGGYSERVIHSFQGPLIDGQQPRAPLIFDAQGNLYGTTSTGGQSVTAASGTVFKLMPQSDGTWQETVLSSFNGALLGGTDGGAPLGGLLFDAAGNLFGTTEGGGTGTGCSATLGTGAEPSLS
jgi:hypothetical protein